MFDSLAEYPHWFVLVCVFVAAGGLLWILMQLVKMAMWAFFLALVIALVVAGAAYFLR